MELMLEIISRQKFTVAFPTSHVFGEVGGFIGRSEECEWCIPDKTKHISRKHALISFDGRQFSIKDLSTNGIISPLSKTPIAKDSPHVIEHGESFTIGEYTIQARLLHRPDEYVASAQELDVNIIPDDITLDLDPLIAMDQQDSHEAKRRLGLYNDLLGETAAKAKQQADHTEPRLDTLPEITAIPENWHMGSTTPQPSTKQTVRGPHSLFNDDLPLHTQQQPIPVLGDNDDDVTNPHGVADGQDGAFNLFHPLIQKHPQMKAAGPSILPPNQEITSVPETDAFFKTLGFEKTPDDPEERERILTQAAELIMAAVTGIMEGLNNRADSKNELRLANTTMRMASNNPLKFSPTPEAAIAQLFTPESKNILSPSKSVEASFHDLHAHNLGILAGARAVVHGALKRIAPETVEVQLDVNGPVRLNRSARLWHTYTRLHQSLLHDHEGFAAFFLSDFARAYEMQQYTLHPFVKSSSQGDQE